MMLQMRRSLRAARMAGVRFEPASVERKEIGYPGSLWATAKTMKLSPTSD